MTLDELDNMNVEFLDIPSVSKYLGKSPEFIRQAIRRSVPWGYMLGGSDYRIPKRAFINYHKNGKFYDMPHNSEQADSYRQRSAETSPKNNGSFDIQEMSKRMSEMYRQMNAIMGLVESAGRILK